METSIIGASPNADQEPATQSAIRAGNSEKMSYSQGQRMLKNVEVADATSWVQSNLSKRTETLTSSGPHINKP